MYKQVRARIEEELGYLASIAITAEISETPHKETETQIVVMLTTGADERKVSFGTDRHNLESLHQSLGELLDEIPMPRIVPF